MVDVDRNLEKTLSSRLWGNMERKHDLSKKPSSGFMKKLYFGNRLLDTDKIYVCKI